MYQFFHSILIIVSSVAFAGSAMGGFTCSNVFYTDLNVANETVLKAIKQLPEINHLRAGQPSENKASDRFFLLPFGDRQLLLVLADASDNEFSWSTKRTDVLFKSLSEAVHDIKSIYFRKWLWPFRKRYTFRDFLSEARKDLSVNLPIVVVQHWNEKTSGRTKFIQQFLTGEFEDAIEIHKETFIRYIDALKFPTPDVVLGQEIGVSTSLSHIGTKLFIKSVKPNSQDDLDKLEFIAAFAEEESRSPVGFLEDSAVNLIYKFDPLMTEFDPDVSDVIGYTVVRKDETKFYFPATSNPDEHKKLVDLYLMTLGAKPCPENLKPDELYLKVGANIVAASERVAKAIAARLREPRCSKESQSRLRENLTELTVLMEQAKAVDHEHQSQDLSRNIDPQ